MICSVDSLRSKERRSAWLRSTATCLKAWISSPARWRLATSWFGASRLPATNSVRRERRIAPRRDLALELVAAARQARGDREADPDRVVDLVRDAGDEAAEGRELLGLDQARLRVAQLGERRFGAFLRGAQRGLGLALGDGVLAEDVDGARHLADLVAGLEGPRRGGRNRRRRSRPCPGADRASGLLMLRDDGIARCTTTSATEQERDDRDLGVHGPQGAGRTGPARRARARCIVAVSCVDRRPTWPRRCRRSPRAAALPAWSKCSVRRSRPRRRAAARSRSVGRRGALQVGVGEVDHDRARVRSIDLDRGAWPPRRRPAASDR